MWTINAYEQVGIEYSRNNYNVTQLYSVDVYRSSDHNPFLTGLDFTGEPTPTPTSTPPLEPAPTETSAPEPTPTSTEGAGPGVSPTMSATPPAAGEPSGTPTGIPGADGGKLATTGAELGLLLPFGGAALLLAGTLALLVKRRADQA